MAGQKKNAKKKRKSRRRNSAPTSTSARAAAPRSTAPKRNPRRATPKANPKRRRGRGRRNPFTTRNPASVSIPSLLIGGVVVAGIEHYVPSLGSQSGFTGPAVKGGAGWALMKYSNKLPRVVQGAAASAGGVLLALAAYQAGKLVFAQYIQPALPGFLNQLPGGAPAAQGAAGLVDFYPPPGRFGGMSGLVNVPQESPLYY